MTQLTNKQIGSTYGDILTTTNEGQGLPPVTAVPLQDGLGNNSPITMSQTIVNINRSGGNQFQLDSVPLTASASSLNSITDITGIEFIIKTANVAVPVAQSLGALTTGLLKNTVSSSIGTLSTAVPGTDYYSPGNPTTILDNGNSLFVGTDAGNLTLTGVNNAGYGDKSLLSLTTGSHNLASGYASAISLTTGTDNVVLGTEAMIRTTTGNYNVSVGSGSLGLNVTGSTNVAIGFGAGATQSQYTSCVFIGYAADASVNGLTNAVAIGNNATVSQSNTIVLGDGCDVAIGSETSDSGTGVYIGHNGSITMAGNLIFANNNFLGAGFSIVMSSLQTVGAETVGALTQLLPTLGYLFFASVVGVSSDSTYAASTNESSYSVIANNPITVVGTNPDFNLIETAPGASISWSSSLTPFPNVTVEITGVTGKTINWTIVTRYLDIIP